MEEIRFKSLNELYVRLLPAFNTKKTELKSEGINVREIDIWNYLKETIWMGNTSLNLYDMVNDVFTIDKVKFQNYVNKTK